MGGNDFTPVDLRVILQTALMRKATALIVAHNHPSGTLTPSLADRQLTQRMQEATALVDLRLHDHIIITDSDYYSFRDQGHLQVLFWCSRKTVKTCRSSNCYLRAGGSMDSHTNLDESPAAEYGRGLGI